MAQPWYSGLISESEGTPVASDLELKVSAMIIAMLLRNAIEDFHCAHLTDAQAEELNPSSGMRSTPRSMRWNTASRTRSAEPL